MPFELIIGAAVGAAATSQKVRKAVRKGVVYGLAGALIAYDKTASFASGVVHHARKSDAAEPVHNGAAATGATETPGAETNSQKTPEEPRSAGTPSS